jgi:hypothetical protein
MQCTLFDSFYAHKNNYDFSLQWILCSFSVNDIAEPLDISTVINRNCMLINLTQELFLIVLMLPKLP